jgi:argininosuccinate lyase
VADRRLPGLGKRRHTGRSRKDQVACYLRLLKHRLLVLAALALDVTARTSTSRPGTR